LELSDVQAQLDDVLRSKSEMDERILKLSREKTDLSSQLDETEEELQVRIIYLYIYVNCTCDATSCVCPSVTSISSHSFKARGLTFGRNNLHIYGSKSVEQNFDILPRS